MDDLDIQTKRGTFIGNVNNLLGSFGGIPCDIINDLFNMYCCSLYGCQTWLLECNTIDCFACAYNKGIRKIWQLPYRAHTDITLLTAKKAAFKCIVEKRFVNLFNSMLGSENPIVHYVARKSLQDCLGVIGSNLRHISFKYGYSMYDLSQCNDLSVRQNEILRSKRPNSDLLSNVVRELSLERDMYMCCDFILERDEINELIHELCVT